MGRVEAGWSTNARGRRGAGRTKGFPFAGSVFASWLTRRARRAMAMTFVGDPSPHNRRTAFQALPRPGAGASRGRPPQLGTPRRRLAGVGLLLASLILLLATIPGAAQPSEGEPTGAAEPGTAETPEFRVLWKVDLAGWAHMMVIQNGVVYTQWSEGSLSMVELRTGRLLNWVSGVALGTAPVVVGNRVYSYRPSQLFELDASTLELLRHFPIPYGTYCENLAFDAETGSVFLRRNDGGNGLVSSIRLQDGSKRWDTDFYFGRSVNNSSSPLSIGDDSVYVQGSDGTNQLWRLDKHTGDIRWVAALGKGNYDEFNNPIYDPQRDVIYSSSFWGECSAVRRRDGEVLWTTRFPDYQIRSTLTCHDGIVYIPLFNAFKPQEPGACAALNADTGRTLWFKSALPGDDGWTATAVCDRYLYKLTHGYEGRIVVQDRFTGELLWSTDVGQGQPCTNPVQSDGIVVFGGVTSLIALQVGVGRPVDCPWHGLYGTGYNPGAIIWDGVEQHPDIDADGLLDSWEVKWFRHLFAAGGEDPDQDGLSNREEELLGSDPHSATPEDQAQTLTFELPEVLPVTAPPLTLKAVASSGLEVQFRVLTGPGQIKDGRLVLLGPGLIRISAEQAGNKLFQAAVTERVLEAVRAGQVIEFEPSGAWRVPDSPLTLAAHASSGLPVQLELVSGPARLDGNQLHLEESGEVTIRAEQAGNEWYEPAVAVWTVPVVRGVQSVVFNLPSEVAATNAPLVLDAFAGTGLPVSYRLLSGPAKIVNDRLVLGGTGLVRVAAEQAGNQAYEPAAEIREMLVHAADQTIEFEAIPQRLAASSSLRLVARASSGLPLTLAIVEGPAQLAENELIVLSPGRVVVRAEQSGNAFFRRVSSELVLGGERIPQAIEPFDLPLETIATNAPILLRASASSGLPVGFRVLTGPARVEHDQLVLLGSGEVRLVAEQAGNSEFLPTSTERALTVHGAGQEIAFDPPPRLRLSDSPVMLTAKTSTALPLQYEVVAGPASVEGDRLTLRGTGEVTVRASQPGNEYFLPAATERQILIERNTQRLDFSLPDVVLATSSPLELDAVSNSALPVTYAVTRGPATIRNNTLVLLGTGWIEVTATQAGNKAFLPTTAVREVLAKPVSQAIEWDGPETLLLSASPVKLDARATSGLPVRFSVVSGPALIRDRMLILLDQGIVVVRAEQEGDAYHSRASIERTLEVKRPAPSTVLGDWIARHFPELPLTQRGPEADPDGDGAQNLVEFLMGTSPVDASAAHGRLPSGQLVKAGNEWFYEVAFAFNPEFPSWLEWRWETCAADHGFEWRPVDPSLIEVSGGRIRARLPAEPGGHYLRLAVLR